MSHRNALYREQKNYNDGVKTKGRMSVFKKEIVSKPRITLKNRNFIKTISL